MKALVFLGLRHTILADAWRKEYLEGKRNDSMLYGYANAVTPGIQVDYCRFNKIERLFFKDNIIGKLYLYCVKLPYLLLKYDVVWTHVDRDALFIARLRRIPIINNFFAKHIANFVWLIDHSQKYSDKQIKKIKKLLRTIDKILYLSTAEKDEFINKYQCEQSQLLYTRYGINFSAYEYNALSVKPIGFDKKDYILSVGTDQHRDLELLDIIAKKNPDKEFVICSGNPDHHKQSFSGDNVTIIRASYNEMVYLYHSCKFVVIPLKFNFHASGITTLLEAAAARKAVLLNYTPGLEDYGQHDNTCLFASLGDVESFDRNLKKLWDNEELRSRLTENAYKYLHPDFNTYKYSKIYIELSKKILGI